MTVGSQVLTVVNLFNSTVALTFLELTYYLEW